MNILGFNVGAVELISYGGAAAFCGFLIWRDAARSKGLQQVGAAAGLAPVEQDVEDLPEGLLALPLFSLGDRRALENTMWGEEQSFVVFDFEYSKIHRHRFETRPGSLRRTDFVQTVCAVHVPGGDIPEFTLAPAGLGDAFLGLFGGRDIDFAQEPTFSGAYLLRGPDPDAIGRLFGRGAARYLGEHTGWTVQGRGEWIVYYRDERTVAPEGLTAFLWEAKAVHSSFFGG